MSITKFDDVDAEIVFKLVWMRFILRSIDELISMWHVLTFLLKCLMYCYLFIWGFRTCSLLLALLRTVVYNVTMWLSQKIDYWCLKRTAFKQTAFCSSLLVLNIQNVVESRTFLVRITIVCVIVEDGGEIGVFNIV